MKESILRVRLKFLLLLLLTLLYTSASAQEGASPMSNNVIYGQGGVNHKMIPGSLTILGSPYINDDWQEANLITNHNQIFEKLKVKYNVHLNEILLLKPDGDSVFVVPNVVKEFTITNNDNQVLQFKKFYNLNTSNNNLTSRFSQVLHEGNVAFVKLTSAKILKANNVQSGGYGTQKGNPSYEKTDSYYFIDKNQVPAKIKLSKKVLLFTLKDKEAAVESYISNEKIDPSTEIGWIKTIKYYDSL